MTIFRWFMSAEVRNAVAMRKHVHRLLCAQRDLLAPTAIENLQRALTDSSDAIRSGANGEALKQVMGKLEEAANKWIRPYPNANWRENVEVLLVALAVAMAIRTFFIQPFKIPTGSMQPTLFGVTSENLLDKPDFKMPTGWARVKEWFAGVSYVHVVAQADGEIEKISPMRRFLIFNIKQSLWIGGVEHVMWFPPDYGEPPYPGADPFIYRARLEQGHVYHKGDDVANLRVVAGDHLFVDRVSYNFRKPVRGEILVFETKGIEHPLMKQDQFYIKRMVVLPGERVQIGNDRHLIINGVRLDASTPHFENVYGFNPKTPPRESQYSGHVNGTVAKEFDLYPNLAPLFPDEQTVFTNGPDSYMVMGDNTCNSFDSRAWGPFPAQNVIGKSFFVYWPITSRFGWGNQ
jgi:signal peptidase I